MSTLPDQKSSKPTYTPGPWQTKRAEIRVDGEYDYAIYDANREVIAEAFGRSSQNNFPPAEANARLIAAAPDLLAALKFVEQYFMRSNASGNFLGDEEHETWRIASEAIDQAESRR